MKRCAIPLVVVMLLSVVACNKQAPRNSVSQTAAATGSCNLQPNTVQRYCNDSQVISVSGNSITIPSNGGMIPTFEEVMAGSPATVSVIIQGCSAGNTCDTLDTNTTVGSSIRSVGVTKSYLYYVVSASWTGGTSPTITVNTQISTATLGAGTALFAYAGNTTTPGVPNFWQNWTPPAAGWYKLMVGAYVSTIGTGGTFSPALECAAGSNVAGATQTLTVLYLSSSVDLICYLTPAQKPYLTLNWTSPTGSPVVTYRFWYIPLQ